MYNCIVINLTCHNNLVVALYGGRVDTLKLGLKLKAALKHSALKHSVVEIFLLVQNLLEKINDKFIQNT